MKFGVVVFPGSNCDMDMVYVLKKLLGQDVVLLWHKDVDLQNCDCIILPGGFSYGDYLRSGAIAKFSLIMSQVVEFAKRGGLVIGICNGFQVLCESGLLPGTLLHNNSHKFICKNVYLSCATNDTVLTHSFKKSNVIKIPIAHAEGRYFADNNTINELVDNDQIIFKYCSESGHISNDVNPNGSILNIAGICNNQRNVFGMMPHPERASDKELKNTDGIRLFENILETSVV